jgi:hypothetical protein
MRYFVVVLLALAAIPSAAQDTARLRARLNELIAQRERVEAQIDSIEYAIRLTEQEAQHTTGREFKVVTRSASIYSRPGAFGMGTTLKQGDKVMVVGGTDAHAEVIGPRAERGWMFITSLEPGVQEYIDYMKQEALRSLPRPLTMEEARAAIDTGSSYAALTTRETDLFHSAELRSKINTIPPQTPVLVLGVLPGAARIRIHTESEGWVDPVALGEITARLAQHRQAEADSAAVWLRVQREVEARTRSASAAAEADTTRERRESLQARGIPIEIILFSFAVNSAGGVTPLVKLLNISSREIKYANLEVQPYNPVGDPVRAEFRNGRSHDLRLVGPVRPGRDAVWSFSDNPPFYARTATCLEVRRVVIEFFDGSTWTGVNDLDAARMPGSGMHLAGECQR